MIGRMFARLAAAVAMMGSALAAPIPAAAGDRPEVFGFVANVTVLQLVGLETYEGSIYARHSFKVRLRSDNYVTGDDGKPIDFEAVLDTNFDTLPKRIYVVIDSMGSRKVVAWTEVREVVCVPPDIAARLDRENEVTYDGPALATPCFEP